MKRIKLTQGQYALVDDADYKYLNQWKWHAHKQSSGNFYAVRSSSRKKGKRFLIRMHRVILGLEHFDMREGDHENHNTLDNRRSNLRICSCQQNRMNRTSNRNTTSRFRGVYWKKQDKKWRVSIQVNGKRKHLGYWNMEEVAALRYDIVAIREHGEFACLNFN